MFFFQFQKKMPVPWAKIFRSRAVYAMVFAHYGQAYGQITLFTEVPAFMAKVMNVDIKTVSFYYITSTMATISQSMPVLNTEIQHISKTVISLDSNTSIKYDYSERFL